jgi:hypothetical protein
MPKIFEEALVRLKSPKFIKLYEIPGNDCGGTNWIKFAALRGIESEENRFSPCNKTVLEKKGECPDLKSISNFAVETLNSNFGQWPSQFYVVVTVPRPSDEKEAPTGKQESSVRDAVLNSAKLWRGKLKSPFVTYPIYYNDQGHKISLRANFDFAKQLSLKQFFYSEWVRNTGSVTERHLATVPWIKETCAQMLWSLKELHDNRLAWNDFTPKNILCRLLLPYKVELNDFDGIVKLDEKGHAISPVLTTLPLRYRANELSTEHKIEETAETRRGLRLALPEALAEEVLYTPKSDLSSVDFTKVDCYSLGVVMLEIKECAYWFSDETRDEIARNQFIDLMKKLLEENPDKRFSVDKAMDHPFFGETAELRKEFFAKVLTGCQPVTIDGFPLNVDLQPNDTFFLLPAAIKKVYVALKELNQELDANMMDIDFSPMRSALWNAQKPDADEVLKPYQEELEAIRQAVQKAYEEADRKASDSRRRNNTCWRRCLRTAHSNFGFLAKLASYSAANKTEASPPKHEISAKIKHA